MSMINDIGGDARAKVAGGPSDPARGAPLGLAPVVEHVGGPASFYRSVNLRYWLGALALGALLWALVVRLF